jgi:hypothetical protein
MQNWSRQHGRYLWALGLHLSPVVCENLETADLHLALCDGEALLVAPRLAGLCVNYNVSMLMSEDCAVLFRQPRKKTVREIDRVRIKGRDEVMTLYAPVAPVKKAAAPKAQPVEELAGAIAAFNEGRTARARTLFRKLHKQNPEDPIVRKYLEKLEKK